MSAKVCYSGLVNKLKSKHGNQTAAAKANIQHYWFGDAFTTLSLNL